jgi:crotonobetainyl-CoA:carnitine CoA-transferase CaiB-like acyl-CoA transferase
MEGVTILEVASYWMVPAATAILADWGADVVKVEHAERGDPMRSLQTGNYRRGGEHENFKFEQANRGKRAIGLNIATEEGREVLYDLVRKSDVFCTSFLEDVRKKLKIDIDDIRRINPDIIYVRGTGQGTKGPDANKPAFDATASWARGGLAFVHRRSLDEAPHIHRPAYGDTISSVAIAAGIAAALFRRATSGEACIVDVSLLGVTAWVLAVDAIAAKLLDQPCIDLGDLDNPNNPLVCLYQTKDGGWIQISMLQADVHWPQLMIAAGRPDLIDDPRFKTAELRSKNKECVGVMREIFVSATTEEWKQRLASGSGVWAVVQSPRDLHDDEQVIANGYINYLPLADGSEMPLVAAPVQFNEEPHPPERLAPLHAEHTDTILCEDLGYDMEKILDLKFHGAVT